MGWARTQVAIGIGLLALFVAAALAAMAAGTGRWEVEVVSWVYDGSDHWRWILWPVMQLGSTPGALAAALIVGLTVDRRAGLVVVISFAVTYGVANLAKLVVERSRPDAADLGGEPRMMLETFAFPSGHSSQAFAVAVAVALVATPLGRWRFALIPVAAATGVARMYYGVHFPGDVLAGAALGTGIALLVYTWFGRSEAPASDPAARTS